MRSSARHSRQSAREHSAARGARYAVPSPNRSSADLGERPIDGPVARLRRPLGQRLRRDTLAAAGRSDSAAAGAVCNDEYGVIAAERDSQLQFARGSAAALAARARRAACSAVRTPATGGEPRRVLCCRVGSRRCSSAALRAAPAALAHAARRARRRSSGSTDELAPPFGAGEQTRGVATLQGAVAMRVSRLCRDPAGARAPGAAAARIQRARARRVGARCA